MTILRQICPRINIASQLTTPALPIQRLRLTTPCPIRLQGQPLEIIRILSGIALLLHLHGVVRAIPMGWIRSLIIRDSARGRVLGVEGGAHELGPVRVLVDHGAADGVEGVVDMIVELLALHVLEDGELEGAGADDQVDVFVWVGKVLEEGAEEFGVAGAVVSPVGGDAVPDYHLGEEGGGEEGADSLVVTEEAFPDVRSEEGVLGSEVAFVGVFFGAE
jgi:hypothetical protein